MAHYLVTGGAGFIGSHIVEHLATATDHKVSVVDNLLTGFESNIAGFKNRISFFKVDITNLEALKKLFKDVDYVIHQAALPSVPRSIADPIKSNWHNVNGTLNVLTAARECGVKRVVAASSSSVYGSNPTLPKVETLPTAPKSPYALTKLCTETYCRMFTEFYGLETVSLRYFNVFGPRQNPESQYAAVIPLFINHSLRGEPITIHGDGEQTRDFTYVDNVVQANIKSCHAPNAAGSILNIGCFEQTSINAICDSILKLTGKPVEVQHIDSRPGDVKHSLADISSARSLLDYSPDVTVQEGLKKTVHYFASTIK